MVLDDSTAAKEAWEYALRSDGAAPEHLAVGSLERSLTSDRLGCAMAFLLGAVLIFGGLLGLHRRSSILILALPIAFLLPCGLALVTDGGTLRALAGAFLASAALQLGFLAGGVASSERLLDSKLGTGGRHSDVS